MLKSAAYLTGRHAALMKLGLAGAPSLAAIKQQMTANAAQAAKPVAETAGTMAHALKQAPAAPTMRGPAQAKLDVHLNGRPVPSTMAAGNNVSDDLLNMPQAQLPPAVPAASPYGVKPVPKRPVEVAAAPPAAQSAADGAAPPSDYKGPFPKVREWATRPSTLLGSGLLAGGAYAANEISKEPQMSVTPSAPLAYYP